MTGTSTAVVTTDRPARYGKQLVAHLGRRNGGGWSDDADLGWIDLGDGRVEVAAVAGGLSLRLAGPPEALERLEDVVGRHLVRFGAKDELVVAWTRPDGTSGSRQP
jgi:hypothetical protein